MALEIERTILDNDIGKIFLASVASAVTAVMIVTPDYQFFTIVAGEFWRNILRIIGNAVVDVIAVLIAIEIILRIIMFIGDIITGNKR